MNIAADPTEFAGKRVLVSGGTKGLGRATVDRFLAGGARVITSARGTLEPLDGVEFASRHGDEHVLWAIFERARDTFTSALLTGRRSSAIEPDDAELTRAMEIHRLAWV